MTTPTTEQDQRVEANRLESDLAYQHKNRDAIWERMKQAEQELETLRALIGQWREIRRRGNAETREISQRDGS